MRRATTLLVALLCLVSCYDHYKEQELVGPFEVTTYMFRDRLRWEGGNTGKSYAEACHKSTGMCFRDDWKDGLFGKVTSSEDKRFIATYFNNLDGIKLPGGGRRLAFYRSDGVEVYCGNCVETNEIEEVIDGPAYWSMSGGFVISARLREHGEMFERIYVLSMRENNYSAIRVSNYVVESSEYRISIPILDPGGDRVAWVYCEGSECSLVIHRVSTGEKVIRKADCRNDGVQMVVYEDGDFSEYCPVGPALGGS